jgi:gamma-glutamylcyclotransferase (GGCT)/AIG2-like uncharacterized protein YtfP
MRGDVLHPLLTGGSTFLGEGRVRGRLLDLGRWPGLIAGAGTTRGELYRLDDPALLAVLDREEVEYNFERRRTVVTLTNGRRERAWVYRYRGPQHRAVVIPDGDYRRARPSRSPAPPGRKQWR